MRIRGRSRRRWRCKWGKEHPTWLWLSHRLRCPKSRILKCWVRNQPSAWWCSWRWTWSSCWRQWFPWESLWKARYIVADLVGPDLGIVNVVVFVVEVLADDGVDLLLHEGSDVIEDSLAFVAHLFKYNYYQSDQLSSINPYKYNQSIRQKFNIICCCSVVAL